LIQTLIKNWWLPAVLCLCSILAAQDLSTVQIVTTQLSPTVYLLQGKLNGNTVGGNVVASVGRDGVLLVDSEYAALSDKMKTALAQIVGAEARVRFIINTHWHKDHTEGNRVFGGEATIVAHEQVLQMLSTDQRLLGRTVERYPAPALPIITFSDSLSMHFNGEEIRIQHMSEGHTGGDSVIFFKTSNVLHTGDLYIGPVFPFVDIDHGGDVVGLLSDIRALLRDVVTAQTKIVPGHRLLATPDDLRKYDAMLTDSIATVRKAIAAGKSLKEVQEGPFPEEWTRWQSEILPASLWASYVYKSIVTREGTGAMYRLPFPSGTPVLVLQGNNGPWGHTGAAAYAYDFKMPIGSPVYAAREGEVVRIENRFEDGTRKPGEENFIFVRHDDGTFGRYYHLTHLTKAGTLVQAGERVKAGQLIAKSGNSGASAGPHLHFDVALDCPDWGCSTIPIVFRDAPENPLQQGKSYQALSSK
jgi:cyclase